MGNDKFNPLSNIIPLREVDANSDSRACEIEDVSEFIVDMLDTLMKIAAQEDQSVLVYFLAMARIEAMEMNRSQGEKTENP